jgi:hypothetical protein
VGTRPGGDDASTELLEEVRTWYQQHRPDIALSVTDEHPIIAAARLTQEDLCVLTRSDTWRLEAACVCFPSRWDLASKIGTTMDEIHTPVPEYDVTLAPPVNAFFDRLESDRSFWRLNWTLLDDDTLHQSTVVRRPPSGSLTDWYFRVERQTLRRLPVTGAIVFTIRNYVTNAAELATTQPDFVENLLHAIETASPAMQRYKGWVGVAERLRELSAH